MASRSGSGETGLQDAAAADRWVSRRPHPAPWSHSLASSTSSVSNTLTSPGITQPKVLSRPRSPSQRLPGRFFLEAYLE
jgi:hypothetical protein